MANARTGPSCPARGCDDGYVTSARCKGITSSGVIGAHRASLATEGPKRPYSGHLTWRSDVTFYRYGLIRTWRHAQRLASARHRLRRLGLDVPRDRDRGRDLAAVPLFGSPLRAGGPRPRRLAGIPTRRPARLAT